MGFTCVGVVITSASHKNTNSFPNVKEIINRKHRHIYISMASAEGDLADSRILINNYHYHRLLHSLSGAGWPLLCCEMDPSADTIPGMMIMSRVKVTCHFTSLHWGHARTLMMYINVMKSEFPSPHNVILFSLDIPTTFFGGYRCIALSSTLDKEFHLISCKH